MTADIYVLVTDDDGFTQGTEYDHRKIRAYTTEGRAEMALKAMRRDSRVRLTARVVRYVAVEE